jgi:5-methylcytosine-specific restriction protein A
MNDRLTAIEDSLLAVRDAWVGREARPPLRAAELDGRRLIAVNRALATLRRQVDALHVEVAAEIARESRPELGVDGLAKQQGYRNPATLIAATTGTTVGEAMRLVKVGEATTPRTTLTGAVGPARHPHVAEGLASGRMGTAAASAIIAMLDRVALRADRNALDLAEKALVEQASGLSLDQLAKIITLARSARCRSTNATA